MTSPQLPGPFTWAAQVPSCIPALQLPKPSFFKLPKYSIQGFIMGAYKHDGLGSLGWGMLLLFASPSHFVGGHGRHRQPRPMVIRACPGVVGRKAAPKTGKGAVVSYVRK